MRIGEERGRVEHFGGRSGPIDSGSGGRSGGAEKFGEGFGFVAGLDFFDVGEIGGIEQLGAEENVGEFGFTVENGFDAYGSVAGPAGARDEEIAAVVAVDAGAEIREVEGVEIDELRGVVATLFDFGHGDDHGFGAEIGPEEGIGSVGVGSDDEFVFGSGDVRGIGEGVEGSAVVFAGGVDGLLVKSGVIGDEGEAVDEGVLGDLASFVGSELRRGRWRGGVGSVGAADDEKQKSEGYGGRETNELCEHGGNLLDRETMACA